MSSGRFYPVSGKEIRMTAAEYQFLMALDGGSASNALPVQRQQKVQLKKKKL